MKIIIPGINNPNTELFTAIINQSSDIIFEAFDDYSEFSEKIVDSINDVNDIIIIDVSLLVTTTDKRTDYRGIELYKWLRIKHQIVNPIFLVGSLTLESLLFNKPKNIILTAPGTKYFSYDEFSEDFNYFEDFVKPIENILESLKPYVLADFQDELKSGHEAANNYGHKRIQNVLNSITKNALIPLTINDHKADFLFKEVDNFRPELLSSKRDELVRLYNLPVYFTKYNRDLREDELLERPLKITYIDDQGSDKWYPLFKTLLKDEGNLHCFALDEDFNVKTTCVKILDTKPDLVLLDLRLKGDIEKNEDIHNISGAKVLRELKKEDPSLPVIMISATDKLKSLKILKSYPYNALDIWTKPRIESKTRTSKSFLNLIQILTNGISYSKNRGARAVEAIKYYLKTDNKKVDSFKLKPESEQNILNSHLLFDTNYFINLDQEIIPKWRVFNFLTKHRSIKPIVIGEVVQELFNVTTNKNINTKIDFSDVDPDGKLNIRQKKSLIKLLKAQANFQLAKFAIEFIRKNTLKKYIADDFKIYNEAVSNTVLFKPDDKERGDEKIRYDVIATRSLIVSSYISKEEAESIAEDENKRNKLTILHADPALSALTNYYANKREKVVLISDDLECKKNIIVNYPGHLKEKENIDFIYKKGISKKHLPLVVIPKKSKMVTLVKNKSFCNSFFEIKS